MKKIIFIILILLSIQLISAQFTFKQNQEIDLKVPCINNGTYCSSSALCNITITYPNGSLLIDNQQMTNQVSFHNITISPQLTLGFYKITMMCIDTPLSGYSTFEFQITSTGSVQTTSEGIGSAIYLILMLALTILFGYIGFKLSESDTLWVLGLLFMVLALFFIVYDVWLGYEYHQNYIGINNESSMPETLFYIFMISLTAGFMVSIALLFTKWKKIKQQIKNALKEEKEDDEDGWDKGNFDNR